MRVENEIGTKKYKNKLLFTLFYLLEMQCKYLKVVINLKNKLKIIVK